MAFSIRKTRIELRIMVISDLGFIVEFSVWFCIAPFPCFNIVYIIFIYIYIFFRFFNEIIRSKVQRSDCIHQFS